MKGKTPSKPEQYGRPVQRPAIVHSDSDDKQKNILNCISDGVYWLDREGRFTFVNEVLVEWCGVPAEEFYRLHYLDMLLPEDHEKARANFKRVMAGEEGIHQEVAYVNARGEKRALELHANPVHRGGRVVGLLGIARDVTARKQAEEALRESEERYRTILDNILEGYHEVDLAGRFQSCNESFLKMLGYSREELIGTSYKKYTVDEENANKIFQAYNRMYRTGEPVEGLECCMRGKDGERRILEASALLIRKGNADPTGFRAIVRDITERKRMEEALRESEERYRTILDEMEEGYHEVDLAGNFTFFNEAFLRIFGYSGEEMLGTNYSVYAADEEIAKRVYRAYNQMYKTGAPLKRYEWDVIRKDGARRTHEFCASLLRDSKGCPIGFRGIVRDVTEHRRAVKALKESEEKYRSILESMNDGYFEADLWGNMTFFNPILPKFLGYTREEMAGMNHRVYLDAENAEVVERNCLRLLRGDIPSITVSHEVVKKDGTRAHVETLFSLLKNSDGKVIGFRGINRDITERKRLEAQLRQAQKMEAIGTLAGGIAHDFNNLLSGIIGHAALMKMEPGVTKSQERRLKSIKELVQSAANLTSQLLGFARLGRYEVGTLDINEILKKTSTMFGRTRKEIMIHRELAQGLMLVEADRTQMEQVFMNLFVNAWQAMPGGGDLYIKTCRTVVGDEETEETFMKPGDYVKVSVTDSGEGMDEATKNRIFEPFFTTKEMGRGTGLGLAMVYGIVKGHNGYINVYSEKGHGTTFNIYLPVSEKQLVREEATSRQEWLTGSETILVVDDEEHVIEVMEEVLKAMGYTVIVARNGKEAVKVFKKEKSKIDLVILDMIMPGIGGGETFDRLKDLDPDIKVILSSGYSIGGTAKEIMEKGCKAFIQKPFSVAELSRKVREVLDGRDGA